MPEKVKVGVKYLPESIQAYMQNQVAVRPHVPHRFHISSLTGCLRKYYYRIVHPERCGFSLSSCFHISRGNMYDAVLTSLFPVSQKTYVVKRGGVSITGTLDFVMETETGERIIVDLKAPKSTFFLKQGKEREMYKKQVLGYLGLAHELGQLLDVHRACVLFIAQDVVVYDYDEDLDILDSFFFPRALALDKALAAGSPVGLSGSEEGGWECDPRFCPADPYFRVICEESL